MIRRTANISPGRARIFIALGRIEEESGCPSGRGGLISSRGIPRRGRPCRPRHTRAPYVSIRDVHPAGLCTWRSGRSNQFHLPATFTWIVCGTTLAVSRGFRRARHFTYAAGCPRANLSGANVTLLDTPVDILVADFGRGLVLSSPHSARLRYTRVPTGVASAPLNRKAAY